MTVIESTPRRHAIFHALPVAAVDRLTADSVAITFDVPDELRNDYRFTAGQHVAVRLAVAGDDVRRNYSICAPADGPLRVAVKRLPGGVFSSYVMERLQPGDTVEVMTPSGRFGTRLNPAQRKSYAAIAAGSGITPILSIITTVLAVEPESTVALVYGNRTTGSVMFLEELEDLKNRYPERFEMFHVLSREPQEVELFSGRLDRQRLERFLATLVPAAAVDEWFICGPFEMVQDLRGTLFDNGVEPHHVHTELFHTEASPPRAVREAAGTAGASNVTVVLDGRTTVFELAPDGQPILDATLAVRTDAPYACKGGVCGTCRAKLTEGSVEMDQNYALEQEEIDDGFVLACQSHPTSPRVSLDFDA